MSAPEQKPPRLARRMYKRFIGAFVAIVLLSAGATAAAGLLEVQDVVDILNHGPSLDVSQQLTAAEAGDPQTILIFGSDHRVTDPKGAGARSDTILLLRMNPDRHVTTVLSVPRDLKVNIDLGNGRVVTDKINSAYSIGGPKLATATVKSLLGIPINHVVNINFHFFQAAVDRLGCVYVDVDRRYYHSNAGLPPSQQYSEIDIPAGYQKLCGEDALAYVRYRHTDSDFVRAARQHDFLRDVKDQAQRTGLASPGKALELAKLLARYTDTDRSLHSKSAILQLVRLGLFSAQQPVQTIPFPRTDGGNASDQYVTATPQQIRHVVREFLHPTDPTKVTRVKKSDASSSSSSSSSGSGKRHRKSSHHPSSGSSGVPGLFEPGQATADLGVLAASHHPDFPVYYPRRIAAIGPGIYPNRPPNDPNPRVYDLYDEQHEKHRAYRMVFTLNPLLGEFYGVQGTSWTAPPLLADPSETVERHGRKYDLFYDGSDLHIVAFHTSDASYWVTNTLGNALSPRQMMGIAESMTDRYK